MFTLKSLLSFVLDIEYIGQLNITFRNTGHNNVHVS